MRLRVGERRRSTRTGISGTAILRDSARRFIARCRVTNVSRHGAFLMLSQPVDLALGDEGFVEMAFRGEHGTRPRLTSAVYSCRVVRIQRMGGLTGLGLELVKKLG